MSAKRQDLEPSDPPEGAQAAMKDRKPIHEYCDETPEPETFECWNCANEWIKGCHMCGGTGRMLR